MAICTDAEVLAFLDIESKGTFTITAANDALVFTSSSGGPVTIDVADGTYEGAAAATALQTAMNANTTLTGTGTIAFAVTYSESTDLFSINAGTGKTIAYTHAGSDGGRTFGFTANVSAAQTISSDTAVPGDPSSIVTTIHDGVEAAVKQVCDRTFDSTAYSLEKYDGTGDVYLWLKQYPVTAISRVSIGKHQAIRVYNTATDCNNATVNVYSGVLTLTVDGGTSAHTDSLTLVSYTTLTLLVAAINALSAYGWSASIESSVYANLKATDIAEQFASYCGSRLDTGTTYGYLSIPDRPLNDFDVDAATGRLFYTYGFDSGDGNVFVSYTAGYTTMPNDLKIAVMIICKYLYDQRNEGAYGLANYSVGHISAEMEKGSIPKVAYDTLMRYKRDLFV